MIRRLFADEADKVHDWVWRDSGKQTNFVPFLADTMNVCLVSGEGGAIFVWRGPGIFELHLFFEQRGREAMSLLRAMLEIMRSEYGAELFWAAIPVESRNVVIFARLMGWQSKGVAALSHGTCELFTGE